jgi:hypothetical protein
MSQKRSPHAAKFDTDRCLFANRTVGEESKQTRDRESSEFKTAQGFMISDSRIRRNILIWEKMKLSYQRQFTRCTQIAVRKPRFL